MSAWEWPRAEDGTRIVGPLPLRALSDRRWRPSLPSVPVRPHDGSFHPLVEFVALASVGYGLALVCEPAAFIIGGLLGLAPTVARNWPRRRDAA